MYTSWKRKTYLFTSNVETKLYIWVGLDGGGGFLKICLSVFDVKNLISCTSVVEKKYLDSGVKKVQILAIAPDVPENYLNMKNFGYDLESTTI